ncbi:irp2 [Klebsiella pneumoniae subsp. ozaenae]|uniref:Irp2 n=1 Tax=Klebsiella pneumoniae subsp. ozaenae TaxID=574 RepID=A0A378BHH3_KLEPO|nr:irp2 [Klebsiella pneumoniae subsp. ozaenae]
MVMENQRRDPHAWCELIQRHQVTLWNSVPALFDMLLTWCEGFADATPENLRAVMLSGDWIGLDLPARYRAFRPQGQFIAMGGATEASIWSNACEIHDVPAHWRSIPYGFPLTNQRYRVVDEQAGTALTGCRVNYGLAALGSRKAYFNDPLRSEQQFLTLPDERWYRTGRSRLLLARWHNRVPRSSRQAGQSRRISHRAGRNRKRAQPAGGGETSNRSGDRRKRKNAGGIRCSSRRGFLHYRSSEPGTAAGVAHACGNVALLRHLARDLRRTGSRFPSASPAKTEAGSHRWRRSSPLMNSLAIQPRWQAVVERWLAFLVTQRRLKPAAEGYQVCAGEEREDEHPHFSGHDLNVIANSSRCP